MEKESETDGIRDTTRKCILTAKSNQPSATTGFDHDSKRKDAKPTQVRKKDSNVWLQTATLT